MEKEQKNGIPCPKCGEEMIDFGDVLLSDPPKISVRCEKCGYNGTRYLEGIGIGEMNHGDRKMTITYDVEEIIKDLEKAITFLKNNKS